jgi:hypothetical protein
MVAKDILLLDSRVSGYKARIAGSGVDVKRPLMDANADRFRQSQRLPSDGNLPRYKKQFQAMFQSAGHQPDHKQSLREPKT